MKHGHDLNRRQALRAAGAAAAAGALGACASTPAGGAADLSAWTATDVVAQIKAGAITAEAYCAHAVSAYRAQPEINAITWFDEARVIEAARAIDRQRAAGAPLGLLAGLPVVVKDNIDVAGFPTTAGTPALRDNRPTANAPVVEDLLRSGAIIFGKTNMHELASGGTTNNQTWGPTRNPYDHSRVPGGSSGGTAAAIAARIVPAGLGSDTLGSTRIPASLCGIAALRPSLVPKMDYTGEGIVPVLAALDTVGPMARTMADVALMHGAITGQAVAPERTVRGVRIGVPQPFYWEGVDAEVSGVCREALAKLRAAGAEIVDVDVSSILEANQIYFALGDMRQEFAAWLATHVPSVSIEALVAGIQSRSAQVMWTMPGPAAADIARAQAAHVRLKRAYADMLAQTGVAALAYPTTVVLAMRIREGGDTWDDMVEVNGQQVPERFITIRNPAATAVFDAPGISLPAGLSSEGLPIGLDFDGAAGGDVALLSLGRGAESVLGVLPPRAV